MKKIAKLTELELKIMRVLWEQEKDLTIQEIAGFLEEDQLSVPSVTQAIRKLVKKKAVEVQRYILVSNVYARTFSPCFSQKEFLAEEYVRLNKSVFGVNRINRMSIITELLYVADDEISQEDIQQLQEIIDRKKEELARKENE